MRRWMAAAVLAALVSNAVGFPLAGASPEEAPDGVRIEVPATPVEPVRVTGLPGEVLSAMIGAARPVLSVYTVGAGDVPAMLGRVGIEAGALVFRPRLPFVPGRPYRIVLAIGEETRTASFTIRAPDAEPSGAVDRIHPGADTLPENLLRFYVHFTEPMRGGDVSRCIFLEDASGRRIEDALVETVPELWDPDNRRATVLCHPGRIKRGVGLHETMGPALVPGESYRLVVDRSMRTANGLPLRVPASKKFRVIAADRRSSDPGAWRLIPPAAGTGEPLRIELDEPLDHALLARLLTVERTGGDRVGGEMKVAETGTACSFVPERIWETGTYALVAGRSLEDLAGNRLEGAFERRIGSRPSGHGEHRIPFAVGGRPGRTGDR